MKQVLMINRNGNTMVNPELCDHSVSVFVQTGHQYTIAGEATDNLDSYQQCLLCGWVLRDDRTWGALLDAKEEGIPF